MEEVKESNGLSHIDESGKANMVDVSGKTDTVRVATAQGVIIVSKEIMDSVENALVKKGDVLGTARIAGIMAAKKTSDLIPLCHPLMLSKVSVDFELHRNENYAGKENVFYIKSTCTAKLTGKTGVEMEALTGVSVSLLTIYDMCKALSKDMVITDIMLMEKSGGKSGTFCRAV